MAHVQKTVTFDLPDEFEMDGIGAGSDPSSPVTTALGKTSTQDYDGPETLILWIVKEDAFKEDGKTLSQGCPWDGSASRIGTIEDSWDKDNYTDMPVPANCRVEELHADSDENMIKIGILHSGFDPEPKLYEVRVGPSADHNAIVRDPSNPQFIYSENDIVADYTKPLVFRGDSVLLQKGEETNRYHVPDDSMIRGLRNSRLNASDGKVADDMPAALKKEWEDYRQKLRDIPQDWAAVPNKLIKYPTAPDGEYPDLDIATPVLDENGTNPHPVIRIADRTAADNDAINQLVPIAGIDETEDDLL